jgi:hypothetical protein
MNKERLIFVVGLLLLALSGAMIWMVYKAIPSGLTIYVNHYGVWETIGDFTSLSVCLIAGLSVAILSFREMYRRR